VLGVDNNPIYAALALVPISSIELNMEEWGYRAAEMLDRQIKGRPFKSPRLIAPVDVVARRSTDFTAVAHPGIAKAARYVRDHYLQTIKLDHIAKAAGISRSSLISLFPKLVGRTVHDEIIQLRLGHACNLLRETPESIGRIADLSGFGGPEHLAKVFRRVLNTTPRAYRKRYL
jgi:LacI family transcriptional regulator